jgi:type II secretory pathway pseudopilin PulG
MIRISRRRSYGLGRNDSGYMLLVLMIAVAVLTIVLSGVAYNYRRSLQRDREVEMIHRGEQYERAVRRYFHKNGRYPTTIEQLESTNNIRYLRKRYKDPMSADGEWKIAHITDIKLKGSGPQPTAGAPASGTSTPSSQASSTDAGSSENQDSDTGTTTGTTVTTTGSSGQGTGGGNIVTASGAAAASQVLGGGSLYGVVSKSKKVGIHSFGDKTRYNEWFFIYDPGQDKGQLPVGPYNPNMFVGTANSGLSNPNNQTPGAGGSGSTGGLGGTSNTPTANTPGTVAPTPPTPNP